MNSDQHEPWEGIDFDNDELTKSEAHELSDRIFTRIRELQDKFQPYPGMIDMKESRKIDARLSSLEGKRVRVLKTITLEARVDRGVNTSTPAQELGKWVAHPITIEAGEIICFNRMMGGDYFTTREIDGDRYSVYSIIPTSEFVDSIAEVS